jgi:hypothetical protein
VGESRKDKNHEAIQQSDSSLGFFIRVLFLCAKRYGSQPPVAQGPARRGSQRLYLRDQSSVFGPRSELAKVTQGKKLAIDRWDSFHQIPGWYDMIEKAFGLPPG